ncbi:MAG: GIY-YIG nuclease family protein [Alphaproteobacteria bacterium]|nr:GIY-YIG nuclease family protein [Alphaproteobacteria bacterium]
MKTGSVFIGDQASCKAFLRSLSSSYVYILRRPDGRPFYVGKGKAYRVLDHENEARHPNDYRSNPFKLNVIRKIKSAGDRIIYEIDFVATDEATALAREMFLISSFKRLHEGGPLTNLDPGGGSTAGNAPHSKERHSATLAGEPKDNPERATLNRFVLNIAPMRSAIFKPVGQFIPKPTQRYPSKSMAPTLRQAAAIVASAAANGVSLDGPCRIPRRVIVDGVAGFVENGVACDILTSGLGTILSAPDPADELFDLTADQARQSAGLVGFRKCVDVGVISADSV